MSGHSKWSTIKRKKGALDAKRSALFGKLARLIEVTARTGSDPSMNFTLKLAIQKAKAANMPNINIEKAIKKGSGLSKNDSQFEEIIYEGLGPGNIAVIIQALTDNKNRTVAEIRNIFTKNGGNFGTSVSWQFEHRGVLQVEKSEKSEEQELAIIDSGALDFQDVGDTLEIHTNPKELDIVKTKLEEIGFKVTDISLDLVPKNKIVINNPIKAKKVLTFLDLIEEHDDVSNVYSNLDVPDEILNQLQ